MSDGCVTVAQCVDGLPHGRFALELLLFAFMAWFLLGAINESSPLTFSFIKNDFAPGHSAVPMAAALALGNFVAILVGGWVADRFGRISVVRPALLMTVACSIMVQATRTYNEALLARFALGLASGGMLSVVPVLLAELLPARHRGFYVSIWTCGWPAGALFSVMVGCMGSTISWRMFYTMLLVPAAMLYLCLRAEMVPESPRYLYLSKRNDEGYNVLLDMYEAEMLPLPWAAETIGVTCKPASAPDGERSRSSRSACHRACVSTVSHSIAVACWLAVVMFCTSAAAQSMKLWMPMMIAAQRAEDSGLFETGHYRNSVGHYPYTQGGSYGDLVGQLPRYRPHLFGGAHRASLLSITNVPYALHTPSYDVVLVFTQAYIIELLGIIVCAYMSTSVYRKHMIQWSLLAAALLTLVALAAADSGFLILCGPLIGLQLAAQIAALNFLQIFASEYFPTSQRATATAFVNFAAQLGNFVVPLCGGAIIERFSAGGTLVFFSALYLIGWVASLRLPLPTSCETPLHDVEEPRGHAGGKKPEKRRDREWTSYQTM